MTLQDILAAHWTPEQLYRNLKSTGTQSEQQSNKSNEIRLSELSCMPYKDIDNLPSNYAILLVKACIDALCRAHNRQNPMPHDERMETARLVVKRYGSWRINELKAFEEHLLLGDIAIIHAGVKEYDLKSIDRASLLLRFKLYDENTRSRQERAADTGGMDLAELDYQRRKAAHRCPFETIYNDWDMTHDYEGNLMPPGWDFEAYWNEWYATHMFGGKPAPPDFDYMAYWTGPGRKEGIEAVLSKARAWSLNHSV